MDCDCENTDGVMNDIAQIAQFTELLAEADQSLIEKEGWIKARIEAVKNDLQEITEKLSGAVQKDVDKAVKDGDIVFVQTFESYIVESHKTMSVKKGQTVRYAGKRYRVEEANDYIIHLVDEEGKKLRINMNQFKKSGSIVD